MKSDCWLFDAIICCKAAVGNSHVGKYWLIDWAYISPWIIIYILQFQAFLFAKIWFMYVQAHQRLSI